MNNAPVSYQLKKTCSYVLDIGNERHTLNESQMRFIVDKYDVALGDPNLYRGHYTEEKVKEGGICEFIVVLPEDRLGDICPHFIFYKGEFEKVALDILFPYWEFHGIINLIKEELRCLESTK